MGPSFRKNRQNVSPAPAPQYDEDGEEIRPVAKHRIKPPVIEPIVKPVPRAIPDPMVESIRPTFKAIPGPPPLMLEPMARPVIKTMPEPMAEPMPKPSQKPVFKPMPDLMPEPFHKPTIKVMPEPPSAPLAEPLAKQIPKAMAEPMAEPMTQPISPPGVKWVMTLPKPTADPMSHSMSPSTEPNKTVGPIDWEAEKVAIIKNMKKQYDALKTLAIDYRKLYVNETRWAKGLYKDLSEVLTWYFSDPPENETLELDHILETFYPFGGDDKNYIDTPEKMDQFCE